MLFLLPGCNELPETVAVRKLQVKMKMTEKLQFKLDTEMNLGAIDGGSVSKES